MVGRERALRAATGPEAPNNGWTRGATGYFWTDSNCQWHAQACRRATGPGRGGIRVALRGWLVAGYPDDAGARGLRGHRQVSGQVWRGRAAGGISLLKCQSRAANTERQLGTG